MTTPEATKTALHMLQRLVEDNLSDWLSFFDVVEPEDVSNVKGAIARLLSPNTVHITFWDEDEAKEFAAWLDNVGEQYYHDDTNEEAVFHYDHSNKFVEVTNTGMSSAEYHRLPWG